MSVRLGPIIVIREETAVGCQIVRDGEDLGRFTWEEIKRRAEDPNSSEVDRALFAAVLRAHAWSPPR